MFHVIRLSDSDIRSRDQQCRYIKVSLYLYIANEEVRSLVKDIILITIYDFIYIFKVLDNRLVINDPELRKQLTLTTADLRFADYLVKSVCDERGNTFLDETGIQYGEFNQLY